MKFQSGIYFLYFLISIGYLSYRRARFRKARRNRPPSTDERYREDYLAWLAKAKQQKPNEPSEVYKYWFLAFQKTSDSSERDSLMIAFMEKKRAIELASRSSISNILGRLERGDRLDAEFVRILYYHFLLLSIFSEEKIRLETSSLESIEAGNRSFEMDSFREYLCRESFSIAFIDLLPEKLRQLSELSRRESIDPNIVNFFDEDIYSDIRLDAGNRI